MDWQRLAKQAAMAPSFDREEYEKLREKWASEVRFGVPPEEYDCPACGNLRTRLYHREGIMAFGAVPCSCEGIRKNWQHIRQSGMEELLQKHSFENFRVTEPWQRVLLEGTIAYAADARDWLMLAGQSGAGKTHLCSAVCRSLAARQLEVVYMPWREEIVALKGMATDFEGRQKRMDRFLKAPYLLIDDLFKSARDQSGAAVTKSDIEHAFELLNYRYNRHLPTIISTELLPGELQGLDEALYSRIVERCGSHIYTVKRQSTRNHRLKQTA